MTRSFVITWLAMGLTGIMWIAFYDPEIVMLHLSLSAVAVGVWALTFYRILAPLRTACAVPIHLFRRSVRHHSIDPKATRPAS